MNTYTPSPAYVLRGEPIWTGSGTPTLLSCTLELILELTCPCGQGEEEGILDRDTGSRHTRQVCSQGLVCLAASAQDRLQRSGAHRQAPCSCSESACWPAVPWPQRTSQPGTGLASSERALPHPAQPHKSDVGGSRVGTAGETGVRKQVLEGGRLGAGSPPSCGLPHPADSSTCPSFRSSTYLSSRLCL